MQDQLIGRFDKSFLIHMIKDFFLVLLLVTALEFALKACNVYWDYQTNGTAQAEVVAEELVDNVVSIMRNSGGPVAASALYPILDKNWKELGYEIAIEPSPDTSIAIQEKFGYTPVGIPKAVMADGEHMSAAIDVKAEAFCTSCHSNASIGDVLGTVTVRNYLGRDFELWWEDVKLTLGLAVGKIVLHSILLFLILRARMEPLLRLRSVVSKLSKAYTDLGQRADVRTPDEFGVLARDLNVFLDRIERLIEELGNVLKRVVTVNDDILQVQSDLREQIDRVVSKSRALERDAMFRAKREPRLSNVWFESMKRSVAELDNSLSNVYAGPEVTELLSELRAVVANAEAQIENSEGIYIALAELGDDAETLKGPMAEMTRLEERMQGIIETGADLVNRLHPNEKPERD
jgi:methyl-accepting chemotaxis protein